MAFSKITLNGVTLMDVTSDTATASTVRTGYTATGADGVQYTGTYSGGGGTYQSKTATPSTSQQIITPDAGYDALSQVTINAMPSGSVTTPATTITANPTITIDQDGLITATTSATKQITPTVSAGYVSSGTAGTVTVSGSNTNQQTTQAATTITPSESSQQAVASGVYTTGAITVGAIPSDYIGSDIYQIPATTYYTSTTDQTIQAGQYLSGTQRIKAVTTTNLTAANVASGVTVQVGDSSDSDRVASVTGTYTNDATLSSNNQMLSGYTAYSNGTKYTGSITSKSAATYTPTTSNQTISAGQYLSGVQTIAGDANQVSSNIQSGVSIFGVAGTVAFVTYYTGSSDPSSSLGNDGDIYFKTGG